MLSQRSFEPVALDFQSDALTTRPSKIIFQCIQSRKNTKNVNFFHFVPEEFRTRCSGFSVGRTNHLTIENHFSVHPKSKKYKKCQLFSVCPRGVSNPEQWIFSRTH